MIISNTKIVQSIYPSFVVESAAGIDGGSLAGNESADALSTPSSVGLRRLTPARGRRPHGRRSRPTASRDKPTPISVMPNLSRCDSRSIRSHVDGPRAGLRFSEGAMTYTRAASADDDPDGQAREIQFAKIEAMNDVAA